ncbi:hypothetical protein C8Q77DRAFT_1097156 [Trametes polyzona]|nr:hypothetical protein C8Q77DRAFT_1097156 [Trametes polyzona]
MMEMPDRLLPDCYVPPPAETLPGPSAFAGPSIRSRPLEMGGTPVARARSSVTSRKMPST